MNSCVAVIFLALLATSCYALKCQPCNNKARCKSLNVSSCKYGITTDYCNCCDVCAKGVGESCGGKLNLKGKCGIGLVCIINKVVPPLPAKCPIGTKCHKNHVGRQRTWKCNQRRP